MPMLIFYAALGFFVVVAAAFLLSLFVLDPLQVYSYTINILALLLFVFYLVRNFINYNKFVYVYLIIMYLLFVVSLYVQACCYSNNFFYVTNLDFVSSANNTTHTLVSFRFDNLSCAFSSVTIQISFFANLYAYFYNKEESECGRFFFLINLFSLSMIYLLHSGSFINLFFFWEMIGLSSFFLINFYHYKTVTFKSAIKAMSFNKISDFSLLVSIVVYYNTSHSFIIDYTVFNHIVNSAACYNFFFVSVPVTSIFFFFILVSSFIKSAQIGFHFWLPDSMEAPLPASALIHSATLVAAGIYLVSRFVMFVDFDSHLYNLSIVYFSITYVFGSVCALAQTDIKKLLAYSTISNCGLMFLCVVLCSREHALGFFTLHGWFKSISFLIAGQLVIIGSHYQDLRFTITKNYLYFLQTSTILVTFFGLSAFWFIHSSVFKHLIFENEILSILIKSLFVFGSWMSQAYTIKFLFLYDGEVSKHKLIYREFDVYVVYQIFIYVLIIFSFIIGVYSIINNTDFFYLGKLLSFLSVIVVAVYLNFIR